MSEHTRAAGRDVRPAPPSPPDTGRSEASAPSGPSGKGMLVGLAVFVVVLVIALTWAKWLPYVHKTAGVLHTGKLDATSSVTDGSGTPPAPSWHAAWSFGLAYFKSVWMALLAALVIASAVEAFLPRQWLVRVLTSGPRRLGGSLAGGLLSMPSMMCTCCTAPVTASLRRRGVPTSSALAYWIGNPTLNPAVLVFMAVVLPLQWVGVRIVAGILLVFLVPPLVARLSPQPTAEPTWSADEETDTSVTPRAALGRFARTFGRLSLTLVPEYLVIVLGLGAVRAWMFPISGHLAEWGVLALVALAVAGALFVIPTAGEIPIIQGLLHAGMGAGPVGALLVTLPALSLPSLIMLRRSFPARVLLAVLGAVVVVGIGTGLALWAL
ncbi:permease [Actinopolymorpha rutila]|uniref:Permease n=1 Tax=Actinopolymorpha rutila TaxID=446787 RepID=A0A852ZJ79_9ACTN|nr:permease [Actinopolymorpha rutila]NYH89200.1 hypothetical protein [Actinopolymorpha rutila]